MKKTACGCESVRLNVKFRYACSTLQIAEGRLLGQTAGVRMLVSERVVVDKNGR